MQHAMVVTAVKIDKFQMKTFDIFLIFAQKIDRGYCVLEQSHKINAYTCKS